MYLLFLYVMILYLGVVYIYIDSFSSTSFSEVLDLMLASKSSFPIEPLPLSLFHKLANLRTFSYCYNHYLFARYYTVLLSDN